MSWSHLIIIVRITWSLATIYLKPKYAAWPQAISSNSLGHGRLPKTISTQALFLDFGLLGVCHMAACHNPSQTIVCCLAACRNPSAPRVCRMAACRNPSAPRVCHMAACRFPSPKLEGGTLLCRLDACHFPSYRSFVLLKITWSWAFVVTLRADEWFITSMSSFMAPQSTYLVAFVVTLGTAERFITSVDSFMSL